MKAIVVYESHWGNTATVARAIAEGIGRDAIALTTDAADTAALADADLIVVGAPVLGFSLASDGMRASLSRSEAGAPVPPDLSHPSMKSWLDARPFGRKIFLPRTTTTARLTEVTTLPSRKITTTSRCVSTYSTIALAIRSY